MEDERHDSDDEEHALVRVTPIAVLGAGLLALFLGYPWFWMVFAFGFAVLVPAVKILTDALTDGTGRESADRDERAETDADASTQDALDTLRDRYARGELSDEQFERKLERLLETETPERTRDRIERDRTAGGSSAEERVDAELESDERAR